ncbi:MAG: hypothetical protein IT410_01145 [Candidatus Doudnabacteria bacterium]|nr:hypothetical protein [Candidatus Doudnabacteria bacterium]
MKILLFTILFSVVFTPLSVAQPTSSPKKPLVTDMVLATAPEIANYLAIEVNLNPADKHGVRIPDGQRYIIRRAYRNGVEGFYYNRQPVNGGPSEDGLFFPLRYALRQRTGKPILDEGGNQQFAYTTATYPQEEDLPQWVKDFVRGDQYVVYYYWSPDRKDIFLFGYGHNDRGEITICLFCKNRWAPHLNTVDAEGLAKPIRKGLCPYC